MPDDLPGGGGYVELVQGKLQVEVILLLPVVVAPLVYQVTPHQGLGGVPDPALNLGKIGQTSDGMLIFIVSFIDLAAQEIEI